MDQPCEFLKYVVDVFSVDGIVIIGVGSSSFVMFVEPQRAESASATRECGIAVRGDGITIGTVVRVRSTLTGYLVSSCAIQSIVSSLILVCLPFEGVQ
jgi:hypothetical protein